MLIGRIPILFWSRGISRVMSRRLAQWVNSNLSFREEYRGVFGVDPPYGNLPCPWHQGASAATPAAKIYGNVCHCFGSCNRNYDVYDFLRKFNPQKLRSVAMSGVVSEERLSLSVRPSSRGFSYKRLSDAPQDLQVGSFEFFEWMSKE